MSEPEKKTTQNTDDVNMLAHGAAHSLTRTRMGIKDGIASVHVELDGTGASLVARFPINVEIVHLLVAEVLHPQLPVFHQPTVHTAQACRQCVSMRNFGYNIATQDTNARDGKRPHSAPWYW